jgi:signal transduction histidine kinase
MRYSRGLRLRVAAAFAVVGGVVSLLMALGLDAGVRGAGERLMDDILGAEMQDYLARRGRNPQSLPPATATLAGYVRGVSPADPPPPAKLAALPPGRHDIRQGGIYYRAAVADHAGARYYLLYDETLYRDRLGGLRRYLAGFVLLMTLASGGVALWLAERVIEPVKELARRVRAVRPEAPPEGLSADFPPDELGELAGSFEQTLHRLASFIDRERAFTADVSHELRTPIAAIRGAAEVMLADAGLPAASRTRLERIERGAADMADLSTALLAMAREHEDGRPQAVDVAALLQQVVERHRHLLGARAVDLRVDMSARPQLAADPSLLGIVMGNLIRNSFNYTERGSVHISLQPGALRVRDTGLGIPQAALARVFDRLHKGAHSQGAGIGLSLVKKICDRHGWRIRLQSEEGRGTEAVWEFS